jgi:hypothetical protein
VEALLKPKKARAPKKKKEIAPPSPASSAGPSSARAAIESDKENTTKIVGKGTGKAALPAPAKAPAVVPSVLAKSPAASGSSECFSFHGPIWVADVRLGCVAPSVHQMLMMAGQKRPAEGASSAAKKPKY